MAEFFQTMKSMSEAPLKEQVDGLADVIEKIMTITLKIPEMTDMSIQALLTQIEGLSTRITALETLSSRISAIEGKMANLQSGAVTVGAPSSAPGAPPPPPPGGGPGAPPGAPPPPPGRAAPAAPANPVSLRGSIMDELKSLFSKRRTASDDDDDDDDDD